jgi:hypothetical protein
MITIILVCLLLVSVVMFAREIRKAPITDLSERALDQFGLPKRSTNADDARIEAMVRQ